MLGCDFLVSYIQVPTLRQTVATSVSDTILIRRFFPLRQNILKIQKIILLTCTGLIGRDAQVFSPQKRIVGNVG